MIDDRPITRKYRYKLTFLDGEWFVFDNDDVLNLNGVEWLNVIETNGKVISCRVNQIKMVERESRD